MKHILLTIWLGVIAMGQLCAQEVTYWVGTSDNPDPIMRHHEAFMCAFMEYILTRPMQMEDVIELGATGSIRNESIESLNNDTCHLEIVSSVTHEGRETITISIGCGPLVKYEYLTKSVSSGDVLQTTMLLDVTYQDETNRSAMESVHEYRQDYLTGTGTAAVSQFSYKCTSISKYK